MRFILNLKSAAQAGAFVSLVLVAGAASAKSSCEDVTAQIEAKIKAKGVKDFTLTVMGKDDATDLRVVGTCDGGAKKIVYKRG